MEALISCVEITWLWHTQQRVRGAAQKEEDTWRSSCSYRTLQNHGHSLLLLHHVEVLAKVRCHVPLSQIFWIILIHPVEVPLFVRGCGRGWWGHHWSLSITIHCTIFRGSYRIKMKESIVSESMCKSISQWAHQPDKHICSVRTSDCLTIGAMTWEASLWPWLSSHLHPCTSQWHFLSLPLFFSRQQNNLTKLLCLLTTWRTR